MVCAQMIFKSLTDPYSPCQRRLVPADPSVDARGLGVSRQGAGAARLLLSRSKCASTTCMWRCLAPHHAGSPRRRAISPAICGTFVGGIHPDTGRQYTIIEPQLGGWGASCGRDGNSAMFSRLPRRDLQLPGRNHRGAQRPDRRSHGAQSRARRRGQMGGRARHRDGLSHPRRQRLFLTVGYTRSRIPALGARRRPGGIAQLCPGARTMGRRSAIRSPPA